MGGKMLYGETGEPQPVRYRCTADAAHTFDEDEIARDALNRPICPACGAVMQVA